MPYDHWALSANLYRGDFASFIVTNPKRRLARNRRHARGHLVVRVAGDCKVA